MRSRFSCRSFRVSGPTIWNDLPVDIRSTDITREQFKRSLKSWLFECAYGRRRVWETVQSEGALTYMCIAAYNIFMSISVLLSSYGLLLRSTHSLSSTRWVTRTVPLYIRSQQLMLADFQNFLLLYYSKKFATKLMPRCPPHLRCVAALRNVNERN